MKSVIKLIAIITFIYHLFSPMVHAQSDIEVKEAWSTLSKSEKAQMRKRYERFQNMSPDKKERIKRKHKWFQSLPKKERTRLKEEFKKLKSLPKKDRRRKRKELMRELRNRYRKTQ